MRVFIIDYAGPEVSEGQRLSCHAVVVAQTKRELCAQLSRELATLGRSDVALADVNVREVATHEAAVISLPLFDA